MILKVTLITVTIFISTGNVASNNNKSTITSPSSVTTSWDV